MLWPIEPAVHTRDVEQRLLQLDTLIARMEREIPSFPIGNFPVSNNFPLPPLPPDTGCSTVCISGTPTIAVGASYAYRRLEIDGVYLDYDDTLGYWVSADLPDTFLCAAVDQTVRWKFSATGVGVGQCLLEFQYYNSGLMDYDTLAEYVNTAVWNTSCGLSFASVTNDLAGCETAYPAPVCVNPVNLCDGEAATFFETTRVLTFTVSGIVNGTELGCTNYNRSWSLAYGSYPPISSRSVWREKVTSGINDYYGVLDWADPTFLTLWFSKRSGSTTSRVSPLYSVNQCDVLIPGVTEFTAGSGNGLCDGWPATLDVTVT